MQERNKITPRGKIFWDVLMGSITWCKTWLSPFKYYINNEIKEVHFKTFLTIYPVSFFASTYTDVEDASAFCKDHSETLTQLFHSCPVISRLWTDIVRYLFALRYPNFQIIWKMLLCTVIIKKDTSLELIFNLDILMAKFYMRKQKFASANLNAHCISVLCSVISLSKHLN